MNWPLSLATSLTCGEDDGYNLVNVLDLNLSSAHAYRDSPLYATHSNDAVISFRPCIDLME